MTNTKKNFWRATAEWTLVQLLPWASNYYIRKADFARISLNTISNNFKTSEWDDNNFFNNEFLIPTREAFISILSEVTDIIFGNQRPLFLQVA